MFPVKPAVKPENGYQIKITVTTVKIIKANDVFWILPTIKSTLVLLFLTDFQDFRLHLSFVIVRNAPKFAKAAQAKMKYHMPHTTLK
jgi:hypothetical protein